MTSAELPRDVSDVLDIPNSEVPDAVRALIRERQLSTLVARMHRSIQSQNPQLRRQARLALRHLGFDA